MTATDAAVTGDVGVDLGGAITQTNSTISGTVDRRPPLRAYNDFLAAYDALALKQCGAGSTSQPLSGQKLTPGIYCFDAGGDRDGRRVDARRVLGRYLDFQNWDWRDRRSRAPTSRWSWPTGRRVTTTCFGGPPKPRH